MDMKKHVERVGSRGKIKEQWNNIRKKGRWKLQWEMCIEISEGWQIGRLESQVGLENSGARDLDNYMKLLQWFFSLT